MCTLCSSEGHELVSWLALPPHLSQVHRVAEPTTALTPESPPKKKVPRRLQKGRGGHGARAVDAALQSRTSCCRHRSTLTSSHHNSKPSPTHIHLLQAASQDLGAMAATSTFVQKLSLRTPPPPPPPPHSPPPTQPCPLPDNLGRQRRRLRVSVRQVDVLHLRQVADRLAALGAAAAGPVALLQSALLDLQGGAAGRGG